MEKYCLLGWFTILFIGSGFQSTQGAKILALMNVPSRSHYIFNRALLIALAEKGHQVTVVSPDVEKKPIHNMNSIQLEGIYDAAAGAFDYDEFLEWSLWDMIFGIFEWGSLACEAEMKTAGAQKLLNSSEKFDLIISEVGWGECFFGFIHMFGTPPVVATSGVGVPPWLSLSIANPENPSYVPNFLLSYTDHMSFSERLFNFVIHNTVLFVYQYCHIPNQEAIAKKYFKEDLPPFREIARNFSVVLVNSVFGLDNPRPLLPNVIPIGGMHIKAKPDPLPKDLQIFLDESKHGFIFFSLGTNLRSDFITGVKRQALLDAFSQIPQKVLWKFESDDLPGLPSNVKISKWLPQSDILAHPNIRLFITHCGMMSTMEATYRGVPIVGIPFFLDQRVNLKKFVTRGAGVELNYKTMTKDAVLEALKAVLNNNSYRLNMKKLSSVFKDHPQTALDRAVFWTEYVIRHGGAPHLQSAASDLYWYQYLLLDVIFVLSLGAFVLILIVYFTFVSLWKLFIYLRTPIKEKTS